MNDMPAGTVGLRAWGKLSRADYRDVLEPTLNAAVESGELRLLFVLSDFDGLEHGAWIEDVKTGLEVLVGHHSAWKRFALVTDADWVAKATRMFAWLIPGEVRIFDLDHLEEARAWVTG
jgi:SpoIIAA-like